MLKSVLVGLSASESARSALDYACWLASLFDGKIYLTHVIELPGEVPIGSAMVPGTMEMLSTVPTVGNAIDLEIFLTEHREAADRMLTEGCRHVGQWKLACETRCEIGFPVEKIRSQAESVDLLALGKYSLSEGKPSRLGRLAEPLARQVPQPVLLAAAPFKQPSEIVLVYNGGEQSHRVLTLGAEIARLARLPLRLLTLAGDAEQDRQFVETASRYLSDHGASFAQESLTSSEAVERSLQARMAEQADALVIMGAFSGSWLMQWLSGNPTLSLIRDLENPIIVCSH